MREILTLAMPVWQGICPKIKVEQGHPIAPLVMHCGMKPLPVIHYRFFHGFSRSPCLQAVWFALTE